MRKIVAAAVLLLLVLTGCDSGLMNVDGALQPPKLTQQQNDICEALGEDADDIQLVYPQKGENRSAFLICNMDDEPGDEALVFYHSGPQSNAASQVRINLLDQDANGIWYSVCDISTFGTSVDRVEVGYFGSEDFPSIVVGYETGKKEKKRFVVYRYEGTMLESVAECTYLEFSALNASDRQGERLISLERDETGARYARMYGWMNGAFVSIDQTVLYSEIEQYIALHSGFIESGGKKCPALFVDGSANDGIYTEILTASEERLMNYTSESGNAKLLNQTFRTQKILCDDIYKDGIYMIPSFSEMPSVKNGEKSGQYYTDWLALVDGTFVVAETDYLDPSGGYRFHLPESWKGRVTAQMIEQDEVAFTCVSEDGHTENLLNIQMVRQTDAAPKNSEGYFEIASVGQVTYLAKVNPDAEDALRIGKKEVQERFITLL